jgi:hypothetical protein
LITNKRFLEGVISAFISQISDENNKNITQQR